MGIRELDEKYGITGEGGQNSQQSRKQKKYPYYKTVLVPPKNRKEEQDILNNSRVPIGTKYYFLQTLIRQ